MVAFITGAMIGGLGVFLAMCFVIINTKENNDDERRK